MQQYLKRKSIYNHSDFILWHNSLFAKGILISLAAPFPPISVFPGEMPLENIDIGVALNSMKIVK